MKRAQSWIETQGDPAVVILLSAWRLQCSSEQVGENPKLRREIYAHLELARQAIAQMVGEDYFRENIQPLVADLAANPETTGDSAK